MFPEGLRLVNYAFLVLFIGGFVYTYSGSPPESAARLSGGLLPIAVLALTVFAVHRGTRNTLQAALIANASLWLLYVAVVGALAVAVVSFLPFILFFVNVYFLEQRKQRSAL